MDPWSIVMVLAPIVFKIIEMVEKTSPKKKGAAKKKAALALIMESWEGSKAMGLLPPTVAAIPSPVIKSMAGLVIDGGVAIVNQAAGRKA